MNNRLIKTLLGSVIGLYMLLVCFNNITDYGTNFEFVSRVSGMEDVFSHKRTGWRSISNKLLQNIFYLILIACEMLITGFLTAGVIGMAGKLKASASEFEYAKKPLLTGLFLGVILWFGLFVVIGGEWFLMWQSVKWNGQGTAFSLSICFMLFLIYLSLRDD